MTRSAAELPPLIAAVQVGPEVIAYGGVGAALLLLFRVVFRVMSRNDTEAARQFAALRAELQHARQWQSYERSRAEHYYARLLNDPMPPAIMPMPQEHAVDFPTTPDTIAPPA